MTTYIRKTLNNGICENIGHSLVVDTSFVNLGSCRRCGMIKTHAGEWKLSGNEYYDPLGDNRLTLDYIYKNASDEELEAIVHSIIGRLWEQKDGKFDLKMLLADLGNEDRHVLVFKPTDKELHEVAKGLRKPQ